MKGKKDIFIAAFNVQTLQKEGKIPELIASADSTKHDIVCIQEHRFIHEEFATKEHIFGSWRLITCSAWKKSVNEATGGTSLRKCMIGRCVEIKWQRQFLALRS